MYKAIIGNNKVKKLIIRNNTKMHFTFMFGHFIFYSKFLKCTKISLFIIVSVYITFNYFFLFFKW